VFLTCAGIYATQQFTGMNEAVNSLAGNTSRRQIDRIFCISVIWLWWYGCGV